MLYVILGNDDFLVNRSCNKMVSKHLALGYQKLIEDDLQLLVNKARTSIFSIIFVIENLKKAQVGLLSPILYSNKCSAIVRGVSGIDKVIFKDMIDSNNLVEFYQPYDQSSRRSYFSRCLIKFSTELSVHLSDTQINKIIDATGVVYTGDTGSLYFEVLKLSQGMSSMSLDRLIDGTVSFGEGNLFEVFESLISLSQKTLPAFVTTLKSLYEKDKAFLYGFMNYCFNTLTIMLASYTDLNKDPKVVAYILGKKDFFIKTILGASKKIERNNVISLLDIVVDTLVSLEGGNPDTVSSFCSLLVKWVHGK